MWKVPSFNFIMTLSVEQCPLLWFYLIPVQIFLNFSLISFKILSEMCELKNIIIFWINTDFSEVLCLSYFHHNDFIEKPKNITSVLAQKTYLTFDMSTYFYSVLIVPPCQHLRRWRAIAHLTKWRLSICKILTNFPLSTNVEGYPKFGKGDRSYGSQMSSKSVRCDVCLIKFNL